MNRVIAMGFRELRSDGRVCGRSRAKGIVEAGQVMDTPGYAPNGCVSSAPHASHNSPATANRCRIGGWLWNRNTSIGCGSGSALFWRASFVNAVR